MTKRFILTIVIMGILGVLVTPSYSQTDTITLIAPPPKGTDALYASIVGNQGNATFYYWVITKYPIGNSKAFGPTTVTHAPDTLTGANYIRVNWNVAAGASSYDLLKTTTPNLPIMGCVCGLSLATTSTSFLDTGQALSGYSVSSATVAIARITLNNRDNLTPVFVFEPPLPYSSVVVDPNVVKKDPITGIVTLGTTIIHPITGIITPSIQTSGVGPWELATQPAPVDSPALGSAYVIVNEVSKVMNVKDNTGAVSVTVRPNDCIAQGKVIGTVGTDGSVTCIVGGAAPDPTIFKYIEDFDKYNVWTGAKLGTTAWSAPTQGQSTGSHWGIASMATSDAAADNGFQFYAPTSTQRNIPRLDAASDITYISFEAKWIFKISTVANYTARIGFTDTLGNITPANFFGVRYVAGTDPTFMLETRIGGVPTESAGLALNIAHWYSLVFSSTAKGSMTITLYDIDAATSATHTFVALPAVHTVPWFAVQQTAAQFTSAVLDYYHVFATGLVR